MERRFSLADERGWLTVAETGDRVVCAAQLPADGRGLYKCWLSGSEGKALVAKEGAEADRQIAINDAGIQNSDRVSTANAEIEEYNASIEAYQMDPEAYQLDKYLEAFENTVSQKKKYIVGEGVDLGALYANGGLMTGSGWFDGQSSGGDGSAESGTGGGAQSGSGGTQTTAGANTTTAQSGAGTEGGT